MSKSYYSSYRNPKLIHKATLQMLNDNIENLIRYMYEESRQSGLLGHPEVRIGLVIKLLHGLKKDVDESLLHPVLKDIERLMDDTVYLQSTGDAQQRKECLTEEYHYIQKFINIDDNITLNTMDQLEDHNPPAPTAVMSANATRPATKISSPIVLPATTKSLTAPPADDQNCCLM